MKEYHVRFAEALGTAIYQANLPPPYGDRLVRALCKALELDNETELQMSVTIASQESYLAGRNEPRQTSRFPADVRQEIAEKLCRKEALNFVYGSTPSTEEMYESLWPSRIGYQDMSDAELMERLANCGVDVSTRAMAAIGKHPEWPAVRRKVFGAGE